MEHVLSTMRHHALKSFDANRWNGLRIANPWLGLPSPLNDPNDFGLTGCGFTRSSVSDTRVHTRDLQKKKRS